MSNWIFLNNCIDKHLNYLSVFGQKVILKCALKFLTHEMDHGLA